MSNRPDRDRQFTRSDRDWNRGQNWNRNWNWNGNWNRGQNWNRYGYWNNGYANNSWWARYPYSGRYYGFGSPYYGTGLGFGLGYGLGGFSGFGIPGLGFGSFGRGYYPGYYSGSGFYNAPMTVYDDTAPAPEAYVSTPAQETATENEFLAAARSAFRAGDFAEAQRQANHAIVEAPNLAQAHEMASLAMFAQGDFAGSAAAAHAAVEMGSLPDWPTLYGYYNDRDRYVQHFEKLKQYVQEHPDAPEGRFLLALHHTMMGNEETARDQFGQYLKLVRYQDPMATELFGRVGGDISSLPKPEENPPMPAPQSVREGSPST
jgi:hypothetical protein